MSTVTKNIFKTLSCFHIYIYIANYVIPNYPDFVVILKSILYFFKNNSKKKKNSTEKNYT